MCIFMNCDLLFPAFIGSLFSIKHFQAKVNGSIFSSSSGFRNQILYIYQRGKWARVIFWFESVCLSIIIVVCCFISYAIMSTLFTSTTVLLANYSSGNIKTNSIQPVSACLAFFEMIWHFLHKWFGIFCLPYFTDHKAHPRIRRTVNKLLWLVFCSYIRRTGL